MTKVDERVDRNDRVTQEELKLGFVGGPLGDSASA
jgi:hypothetical protein